MFADKMFEGGFNFDEVRRMAVLNTTDYVQ
jgi:hypothetical protein